MLPDVLSMEIMTRSEASVSGMFGVPGSRCIGPELQCVACFNLFWHQDNFLGKLHRLSFRVSGGTISELSLKTEWRRDPDNQRSELARLSAGKVGHS